MIIGRAYNELNPHNWTSEELFMYDQAEKNENDNVSCLEQSRKEGLEEGRKEGKIEGRKAREIEVAKNLLKHLLV